MMPATAAWIAERIGCPNEPMNPDLNVQMGTWYDAWILSDINVVVGARPVAQDDRYRMMLVGYNAGPGYGKTALRDLLARGLPLTWANFTTALPTASVRGKRANTRECLPYALKILPLA